VSWSVSFRTPNVEKFRTRLPVLTVLEPVSLMPPVPTMMALTPFVASTVVPVRLRG
jgi:hypothetical protein